MADPQLTGWQRNLVQRVADSLERDELTHLLLARRAGKASFRAALDAEMHRRGWAVLAPGVYSPPTPEADDA